MKINMELTGTKFTAYDIAKVELVRVVKDGSNAMLLQLTTKKDPWTGAAQSYRFYVDKFEIEQEGE